MKKVLGIDQSYTSCGLVLVENSQIVEVEKISAHKDWDRYDQAHDVARQIKWFCSLHEPDLVGIEGLAFASMGNATRDLGGLLFTIVLGLRHSGYRMTTEIIPATTIKKFACGYGRAKKDQVYEALPQEVKDLFDEKGYKKTTGRFDMTDAYWIARYREEHG